MNETKIKGSPLVYTCEHELKRTGHWLFFLCLIDLNSIKHLSGHNIFTQMANHVNSTVPYNMDYYTNILYVCMYLCEHSLRRQITFSAKWSQTIGEWSEWRSICVIIVCVCVTNSFLTVTRLLKSHTHTNSHSSCPLKVTDHCHSSIIDRNRPKRLK